MIQWSFRKESRNSFSATFCAWFFNKNVSHVRAYFSSFLRATIAHNHLPFLKIFSNFAHFCPNFQIFCPFLTFFFCPFSGIFWKIARVPLLSRMGLACYILLTDQISLSDCLYFLRYWAICVLWLFVNQVVTS